MLIRIVMFFCLCPLPLLGADLVYSEDFESSNYQDSFRSTLWSYVTRSDTLAHGGTYCLRGNLVDNVADDITGLDGINNPLLEFDANGAIEATADSGSVFIRYWRRFDHCTWDGPQDGKGKGEYFTDINIGTGGFYSSTMYSPDDGYPNFTFSANNATWVTWTQTAWGHTKSYLNNDEWEGVDQADGEWHKFEYFFDYDSNTFEGWMDDVRLDPVGDYTGYYSDGKIPIHPDFVLRGLQFLYVADAQVSGSIDGDGFAVGYQYDDIEVWDDIPNGVGGTLPSTITAPTNLTATKVE
jgi:hypothetical protein